MAAAAVHDSYQGFASAIPHYSRDKNGFSRCAGQRLKPMILIRESARLKAVP